MIVPYNICVYFETWYIMNNWRYYNRIASSIRLQLQGITVKLSWDRANFFANWLKTKGFKTEKISRIVALLFLQNIFINLLNYIAVHCAMQRVPTYVSECRSLTKESFNANFPSFHTINFTFNSLQRQCSSGMSLRVIKKIIRNECEVC